MPETGEGACKRERECTRTSTGAFSELILSLSSSIMLLSKPLNAGPKPINESHRLISDLLTESWCHSHILSAHLAILPYLASIAEMQVHAISWHSTLSHIGRVILAPSSSNNAAASRLASL